MQDTETRMKPEARNPNSEIRHLPLGFDSSFGFRISAFHPVYADALNMLAQLWYKSIASINYQGGYSRRERSLRLWFAPADKGFWNR
jgi:hypothetical protein